MDITLLSAFDQFRFILGTIFAEMIFVSHVAKGKSHFGPRCAVGLLCSMAASLTYFPFITFTIQWPFSKILSGVWWFFASWIAIAFILFCYEISFGNAMFQCILGLTLQQVVTIVLRYIIVEIKYPQFPETHTVLYLIVTFSIYMVFYLSCYLLVRYRMKKTDSTGFLDSPKMVRLYCFIFIAYSLLTDITGGTFSWILQKMKDYPKMQEVNTTIQYFLVGILLLVSIVIFIILFSVYEVNTLKQENELLERMQREKEKQYEYTKENIDIINQKCHDLKHQITALELADDSEKLQLIKETKEAVLFYDSVVKTDNEVLNTILTEKSLICANHNIKLSCTVNAMNLSHIAIVDLYTILGNAIDNAIECVINYADDEKKIISIKVQEKGNILSILVDNFFEGTLKIRHGLLVTSKEDKAYHGYGVKGILMTAKKYGGDIRISNENNTFSLQVVIPFIAE